LVALANIGQAPAPPLVLVGKPYPQYQQVSAGIVQEWKHATGMEPVVAAFPEVEPERQALLRGRLGLVVCLGETPAAWAVQRKEPFPLAFTMIVDPQRLREARDHSTVSARTLHGVSIDVSADEQVAILKKMLPSVRRIGVLTHDASLRDAVAAVRAACEKHGIQLVHAEIAGISELPPKFDQLLGQVDLIWSLPDPNIFQPQLARHIIGQCAARGIPLIGLSASFVKAGATISFERDYHEIGRLLARQSLRGPSEPAPAKNWTIEHPTQIVVSINLRSFEALNLKSSIEDSRVRIAKY
jgi:ABC-type uncharacterized transport system substrate-binding protein